MQRLGPLSKSRLEAASATTSVPTNHLEGLLQAPPSGSFNRWGASYKLPEDADAACPWTVLHAVLEPLVLFHPPLKVLAYFYHLP